MPETPSTTDSINDDPAYLKIFEDPKNGTPDNITKAGCLALLRLGNKDWNVWRKKHPVKTIRQTPTDFTIVRYENAVDFSEIDFEKMGIRLFCFLEFGNGAQFTNAKFRSHTTFIRSRFGDDVNFDNTQFGAQTSFHSSRFGNNANFRDARFGKDTNFSEIEFGENTYFFHSEFEGEACFDTALFEHCADFSDAIFKGKVNFSRAMFGAHSRFVNLIFLMDVNFFGVRFGRDLYFVGTHFCKDVTFKGAQFSEETYFMGAQFDGKVNFVAISEEALANPYKTFYDRQNSKKWSENLSPAYSDTFNSINFNGANFLDSVNFTGRLFEGSTSFGRLTSPMTIRRFNSYGTTLEEELPKGKPVVFKQAPLFHNCKLHQDTTFDGAHFPAPSVDPSKNDEQARAYRTLKLAFAQHQATREEQRFFRLEMAEEAMLAPITQRWLFNAYRIVSKYGFSLSRPVALLLGAQVFFLIIYGWLAGLSPCFYWQTNCYFNYTWLEFGLLQSIPLPGMDTWNDTLQKELFPKGVINLVTISVILHKLISLFTLFLIGLALRNLFKMK